MRASEIRETYLSYFEQRGHLRIPSASLIPAPDDASTLLTVAGMQPFKPYFRGVEQPPQPRLTSCQRCFRTPDIDEVGNTKRHLTNFEMLGNFSFGDYFKREAITFGWELSTAGFGFDPEQIWVTVFGGDDELGLGPDDEAIGIWRSLGVPEERIVKLGRSENFWQAGATGPCGPCSEMYLDRGPAFGDETVRPGDDTERYLEYWNHVFMAMELHEDGSLTELPKKNIDTGLGLERMAAIKQGVETVFDTDLFTPLIELAEELSGRRRDEDFKVARAMRIIADHSRGMVNLIGDGVVPSNEERGYVLRRIMRRAIQQGRVLGIESPYLERFAERAIEGFADVNPRLEADRETILRWVRDEERSFSRTLERGSEILAGVVAEAKRSGSGEVTAADAFQLHDTYGFPFDLTRELLAEQGLSTDQAGFEALMEEQRERARSGAAGHVADQREAVADFAAAAAPSSFVGYERLSAQTSVAAAAPIGAGGNGQGGSADVLVKLEESPFYPEGGGQVADAGVLVWEDGEASVSQVYRLGSDQAIRLHGGGPEQGVAVEARVDPELRHATMRNHTATHLLHAALRERLGTHVRQAGSAVRPDKLRFDFTHGEPMSADELRDVEERVNEEIKRSHPVRAIEMARDEAEALGAMALFGEKYGDWVRMVEVEGVSRELCGGTHVANTAEVGIFKIVSEGSSAANVRRIEAITGPVAIDWYRQRSDDFERAGGLLGSAREPLAAAERAAARLAELESVAAEAGKREAGAEADALIESATPIGEISIVVSRSAVSDQPGLMALADRVKQSLGDSAVVLAGTSDGKVALVGLFSDAAVAAGASAADVVRRAAAVVGGGGGGRPQSAQAGGRDPEKLDEALAAARAALEEALGG